MISAPSSTPLHASPWLAALSIPNGASGNGSVPNSRGQCYVTRRPRPPSDAAGIEADALRDFEDVVAHPQLHARPARCPGPRPTRTAAGTARAARRRRRPQRDDRAPPVFPSSATRRERFDRDDRDRAVRRELPLEKADAENEPEPDGTPARDPQQQDVQERLDVAAARLEQPRRRARRRQQKEHARGHGEAGAEARLALQPCDEQEPDGDIHEEQRQLQRLTETPNSRNIGAAIHASTARM